MTADAPIVARDPVRRVLWARGLRDFGDGLTAVLLPAHLVALGYGAAEVGAVFAAGYQELPLVACGALKIVSAATRPVFRRGC